MATTEKGAKSDIPSGTVKAGKDLNYKILGGLPPEKDVKAIDKENMPKKSPASIRKAS